MNRLVRSGGACLLLAGAGVLGAGFGCQGNDASASRDASDDGAQSDAIALVSETARNLRMPEGVRTEFAGSAKMLQQSLASQPFLIGAAIVSIYIVLGVLYESLLHPLTIISTLPSAGLGALLALARCALPWGDRPVAEAMARHPEFHRGFVEPLTVAA